MACNTIAVNYARALSAFHHSIPFHSSPVHSTVPFHHSSPPNPNTPYTIEMHSRFFILGAVGGSKVTFNPFGTGILMLESTIYESMMPCTCLLLGLNKNIATSFQIQVGIALIYSLLNLPVSSFDSNSLGHTMYYEKWKLIDHIF